MLRQLPTMNEQRHPTVPVVLLLLVIAGLALAGCGGKNRTDQAGEALPAQGLPAQVLTAQPQANSKPTDAVKIRVNQTGLIRVAAKDLAQVGFDTQAHDPNQLSLSLAGAEVPFLAKGDGSNLEFVFYGQPAKAGMIAIMCTGCAGRLRAKHPLPSR